MKRLIVLVAFVAGCGGTQQLNPINNFDFAVGGTDDGGVGGNGGGGGSGGGGATGGGDMAPTNGCSSYMKTTVAAMRMATTAGCFELDNVVTVAVTPISTNSTSVKIIAQDSAGGDYSAILVTCYDSATTKHPCTAFPMAKGILAGRSITVQGYYHKAAAAMGGYESLSLDGVTDNGSGTAPAPQAVMLADVERGASKPAWWFQKVTFTVSATDQLGVYDFSPPEFKSTSTTATACGTYYGFGMKPKSASGTAGAACSGTTQPAGQTTVNPNEVLFGTDYYATFTANSQCSCISSKTMKPYPGLLSATSTLQGSVSAILFSDAANSVPYQYIAPLTNTDAPITNLSM